MARDSKSLMLSGIQPTGELMIGNYVGALKNWVELQAAYESFFLLADLHAITVPQNPVDLQRRTLEFAALLLACGVDAGKARYFCNPRFLHTHSCCGSSTALPPWENCRE